MHRKPRTCTYRVVYWESANDEGVVFEEPPLTRSAASAGQRPSKGPQICEECSGVTDPWRFNMDYVHASIRMCAKEGTGFREEIEDFVCVSPRLVLEYHLQKFRRYGFQVNKKVLTESVVLGIPMLVHLGAVEPKETGVGISHLTEGSDGVASACAWLRGYVARVRSTATAGGGVSALVVVHPDGVEVNGFGLSKPFFAHDPQPPVTQVIVLVAGPNSFGAGVLKEFEATLMGGDEGGGCHVGPIRLSIPSANRAYAALGDLFMCHDREMLLPIIEDIRHLGEERYLNWMKMVSSAITCLAMNSLNMRTKLQVLASFANGLRDCHSSPEPVPEDNSTTPYNLRSRLQVLEDTRGLPKLGKRRHWRSYQWMQYSEPRVVLEQLDHIATSNCPMKLRWDRLADLLEEHAHRFPPPEKRTPAAVRAAFLEACRVSQIATTSPDLEVPSLPPQIWKLPCEKAVNLVQKICQAGCHVKDPAMWIANEVRKNLGVDVDENDESIAKQHMGPKAPAHPPPSWAMSKPDGATAPAAQPKAASYKSMLSHKLKTRLRLKPGHQRSSPRRAGRKNERTKHLGRTAEEALARKRLQPDADDREVRTPSPEMAPAKDDMAEPKAFPKALSAKRQRRHLSTSPRSQGDSHHENVLVPPPPKPPSRNPRSKVSERNKVAHRPVERKPNPWDSEQSQRNHKVGNDGSNRQGGDESIEWGDVAKLVNELKLDVRTRKVLLQLPVMDAHHILVGTLERLDQIRNPSAYILKGVEVLQQREQVPHDRWRRWA